MDITKSFELADELVKQLITISTAVIGLSVTFSKDMLGSPTHRTASVMWVSWVLFFVSICFGIATMMALAGEAHKVAHGEVSGGIYQPQVKAMAAAHILTFLGAIVLLIAAGVIMVRARVQAPNEVSKGAYVFYLYVLGRISLGQPISVESWNTEDPKVKRRLDVVLAIAGSDARRGTPVRTEAALFSEIDRVGGRSAAQEPLHDREPRRDERPEPRGEG
jgi:hypothetical protein